MTKRAEFEEKTYEKFFACELNRRVKEYYPPGQREESHLGFDDAFLLSEWSLFRLFPYLVLPCRGYRRIFSLFGFPLWMRHEHLPGIQISEIDHLPDDMIAKLPRVLFNFFVQYKRPEYVAGRRAAEWSSWHRPYYRYNLKPHQQAALSRVAQASAGRAAVVYAAPTFVEHALLCKYVESRNIVARSNIAPVEQMDGHKRFTYISPGVKGCAHSEPKDVEGRTFEQIMARAFDQDAVPFRDHMIRTSTAIEKSVEGDPEGRDLLEAARAAILSLEDEETADSTGEGLAHALITTQAFSDAFNVGVYMIASL